MSEEERNIRTGVFSAMAAYTMWGFFPIYFKVADGVTATEMLAQRIIWAVPVGALILTFRHQWAEVRKIFPDTRKLRALFLAAIAIATNWGVYIWAVQTEKIFQASLGYYINPLIFVLVGVLVTGEKLSRLQMIAVGLATIGVSILTVYGGVFPWVSIFLGISFTLYGYIRKTVGVGAMPGLFIETLLLLPFALVYWAWLINAGSSAFFEGGMRLPLLLLLAGPFTVLPLLCFAIGARRLKLSTIGFLQYIGPTLQFCVGLYYGEDFTTAHAFCFGSIWIAVAVYSLDAWQKGHPRSSVPRAETFDNTVEPDEFLTSPKQGPFNKDDTGALTDDPPLGMDELPKPPRP
ncbi:EamA family transporter RarD [Parvularcula sp. IMCC14364]|uniref:EamA family transporter RarD n=1 Tax=Parvularcula sp. IMCC14364 TaxID=3067902 RepID=UPI0027409BC8|nr:EamA family transporter RarD [Parvularcula sp. IMCC14364]